MTKEEFIANAKSGRYTVKTVGTWDNYNHKEVKAAMNLYCKEFKMLLKTEFGKNAAKADTILRSEKYMKLSAKEAVKMKGHIHNILFAVKLLDEVKNNELKSN